MTGWRLVADIGGSNARFARSEGPRHFARRQTYAVKDYESFYAALEVFLRETGGPTGCAFAAIGVAGPVDDGYVKLTNAPWEIEAAKLTERLDGAPARLVNDLQAVALALPYLTENELAPIGPAPRRSRTPRTMIAVNIGTGFGAATAIPAADGGWIAHPGEPGHMALGARSQEEFALLGRLGSVEDVLSGRGVTELYSAFAKRANAAAGESLDSADVFARADGDRIAADTLGLFTSVLGRVAGDLVLAAAAWGGAYLCGSVASGWLAASGGRDFRSAFEDKGVMSGRMTQVYSGLITLDDAALIGLTYLPDGARR